MKVVLFTHSLTSCWNHGNAHFQRGLMRALEAMGHEAIALEPADGWSLARLRADQGECGVARAGAGASRLDVRRYGAAAPDLDRALDGADVVIVHEWTAPDLVAAIGRRRARGARFALLFHDTHHRLVTKPAEMAALDLDGYDGVLAFCGALAAIWERRGFGRRAFVWHEAADVALFQPPRRAVREGLVWIGNWGDGERAAELEELLLRPAAEAGLALTVHGVRYPPHALAALRRHGAAHGGWLPNAEAPGKLGRALATIHVPRKPYVRALPGAPTIRVFEALATGTPLVSTLWRDVEGLFTPGEDFLEADTGAEVAAALQRLAHEPELRARLTANGLAAIRERHTCAHRAAELLAIVKSLAPEPAR